MAIGNSYAAASVTGSYIDARSKEIGLGKRRARPASTARRMLLQCRADGAEARGSSCANAP
jgi:hypothetical protein